MWMFCPVDRLRLSKSEDTYGGVSHTTTVSEEMKHGFSCKREQYEITMGKGNICQLFFILMWCLFYILLIHLNCRERWG
jgi:hypothetical protein